MPTETQIDAECMHCGSQNARWYKTSDGERPFCIEHAP